MRIPVILCVMALLGPGADIARADFIVVEFDENDHIDPAEVPQLGTLAARLKFQGLDQVGPTGDGDGSTAWSVLVDNLSPNVSDGTAPALSQFGFATNPTIDFSTTVWTLSAWFDDPTDNPDQGLQYIVIGTNDPSQTVDPVWDQLGGSWSAIEGKKGNLSFSFLGQSGGGDTIKGALYNPLAREDPNSEYGGDPLGFTQARLDINFGVDTILILDDDSPYVRFQNVGFNGEESAKLTGGDVSQFNVVPEPSSVVLLLLGGLCLVGFTVRRKRRAAIAT